MGSRNTQIQGEGWGGRGERGTQIVVVGGRGQRRGAGIGDGGEIRVARENEGGEVRWKKKVGKGRWGHGEDRWSWT